MTAASWEALVTRARQITSAGLNDERRWQLGDVALEVAPVPKERASRALIEEAQKPLGRFAAEVGISVNVVKDARRTAAAWPRTERDFSQSYSRHKALVLLPDRFERIREPRRVPSPPGFTEGQQRAVERVFNLLRRPGVAEAVKAAARNSKTDRVGREAASETIRSENHASQEARRMKRAVERELLEA